MKVTATVTDNATPIMQRARRATPDRVYKAIAKAGGIVKKGASILAPSRRISTALKVVMAREDGQPVSRTGLKRMSKGWYGKFFETGTKQHDIKPKKGKKLAWFAEAGKAVIGKKIATYYRTKSGKYTTDMSNADMIFAKGVRHPGMGSKPFLKPAFTINKNIIKETIAEAVAKTLQEAKP